MLLVKLCSDQFLVQGNLIDLLNDKWCSVSTFNTFSQSVFLWFAHLSNYGLWAYALWHIYCFYLALVTSDFVCSSLCLVLSLCCTTLCVTVLENFHLIRSFQRRVESVILGIFYFTSVLEERKVPVNIGPPARILPKELSIFLEMMFLKLLWKR